MRIVFIFEVSLPPFFTLPKLTSAPTRAYVPRGGASSKCVSARAASIRAHPHPLLPAGRAAAVMRARVNERERGGRGGGKGRGGKCARARVCLSVRECARVRACLRACQPASMRARVPACVGMRACVGCVLKCVFLWEGRAAFRKAVGRGCGPEHKDNAKRVARGTGPLIAGGGVFKAGEEGRLLDRDRFAGCG